MRRVLYLGVDPSRYRVDGTIVHYPIIRTIPVERIDPEIERGWEAFSHVLFTSPSAVKHWLALSGRVDKPILAIGSATASFFREALVAPFATQEGVIGLIRGLEIRKLLWPRSARARPLLETYLKEAGISYRAFDLYQTVAQRLEPVPNLDEVEEIVFTSPSTVEAFLEIFGEIPRGKKITSIGPVTKRAIKYCF